ncbi:MAG TPA: diiron oxygenase [Acidimicrobiales bacterium]|nr:diiron oxygenase [Acidimicrobiales bacterium]
MTDRTDASLVEHIDMGAPASFVWDYDARRPRLSKLYEKSKTMQWNAATDIDWSVDIDPGKMSDELVARMAAVEFDFGTRAVGAFARSSPENRWLLEAHSHAWTVSNFMHGEQGALVATAKICAGVESIDDKYYAAAQVADEARHVEAYQRYLDKIDIRYPVATYLHQLLDEVVAHPHVDMTFLGMQILVEGVALAAFSMGGAMFGNPVIGKITDLVRRDEARHVAFGVLSLQGTYDDMDPVDLAEREDFILEACALMRDRFVPVDVYERLGIDVARAVAEYETSPDQAAFRSLMFSKVVPNLGKLGLLTPKVRAGFEKMGILRYERYVDSATEAGELAPGEGVSGSEHPFVTFRAALASVDRIAPEPVLQVVASGADLGVLAGIEPALIRLHVTGVDDGDWVVRLAPEAITYAATSEDSAVDVTLTMDVETWTDIVAGRKTAPAAVMEGKIDLAGDVMKALVLDSLL